MGLFDEEGSEDGLFGAAPAPAAPAKNALAAGLFDAEGDDGAGLFGGDASVDNSGAGDAGPAAAATSAEPTGSTIVASLFAADDSDTGSVDFEKLVGG
eukprot:COSAG06_NODE_19115_length_852_cov_8.103586_1_plen_97_part_01